MMNKYLINKVVEWAHHQFGLKMSPHQEKMLAYRFELYFGKKGYDNHEFLAALNHGDAVVTREVINLLTVQESYFFRDTSLFLLLEKHFLPQLIQEKRRSGHKQLSIWSAGSAKGEELYSMAILLTELLSDIETWHIRLIGTDINQYGIKKAKNGLYSSLSLRATDESIKEKYFTEKQGSYQLSEKIKKMAVFSYGNVVEELSALECFDIILCRNLFIYLFISMQPQLIKH